MIYYFSYSLCILYEVYILYNNKNERVKKTKNFNINCMTKVFHIYATYILQEGFIASSHITWKGYYAFRMWVYFICDGLSNKDLFYEWESENKLDTRFDTYDSGPILHHGMALTEWEMCCDRALILVCIYPSTRWVFPIVLQHWIYRF